MENPCLTFATPSIIAGDKSLANVIAHEIAHSWSGNLVTMTDWSNFWVNEGFTVFLERKVAERLYKKDMAMLASMNGYSVLEEEVHSIGETNDFTTLQPYLVGVHPDDSTSDIPYEKGYNFLYFLETIVNAESNVDVFQLILRKYFTEYKYKSVNDEVFKNLFIDYIQKNFDIEKSEKILRQIDWNNWLRDPGLPKMKNNFVTNKSKELDKTFEDFRLDSFDGTTSLFSSGHTEERKYFLNKVIKQINSGTPLSDNQYKHIDEELKLYEPKYNAEINFDYYMIMLNRRPEVIRDELKKFLGTYGRMKYLRPIYVSLAKWKKDVAMAYFEELKVKYHPLAVRLIQQDLNKIS